MAVKYGEFEFPSDRGFTGSAGKTIVKSHYRQGGAVKGVGPMSDKDIATAVQQARMTRNAQRTPEDTVRDIKATSIGKGAGQVSDKDRALLDRNAKLGLARGGCVAKKNHQKVGSREPMIKKGLGGIVKKVAGSGLFGLAGLAASGALGGKNDEDKSLAQTMTESQRAKMTGNA